MRVRFCNPTRNPVSTHVCVWVRDRWSRDTFDAQYHHHHHHHDRRDRGRIQICSSILQRDRVHRLFRVTRFKISSRTLPEHTRKSEWMIRSEASTITAVIPWRIELSWREIPKKRIEGTYAIALIMKSELSKIHFGRSRWYQEMLDIVSTCVTSKYSTIPDLQVSKVLEHTNIFGKQ